MQYILNTTVKHLQQKLNIITFVMEGRYFLQDCCIRLHYFQLGVPNKLTCIDCTFPF